MAFQTFALDRVPLAIAYFVAATVAVVLTRFDGGVAFLWLATPLLIADLITRPRRQWLASIVPCAVVSGLATGLFGLGWAAALPLSCVNMLEAWLAAWLLRRYGHPQHPLGSLSWLYYFIFSAGLIAPLVAAISVAGTFVVLGQTPIPAFVNFFTAMPSATSP
ncbi:MAG: MASE1 domain-containing protein [Sphingomicrobium sp.]